MSLLLKQYLSIVMKWPKYSVQVFFPGVYMLLNHSNIWHLFDYLKEEVMAGGSDR
jgi:hypothetical protein